MSWKKWKFCICFTQEKLYDTQSSVIYNIDSLPSSWSSFLPCTYHFFLFGSFCFGVNLIQEPHSKTIINHCQNSWYVLKKRRSNNSKGLEQIHQGGKITCISIF
jgi:hypothetical protein